jgi:hypothetical protein
VDALLVVFHPEAALLLPKSRDDRRLLEFGEPTTQCVPTTLADHQRERHAGNRKRVAFEEHGIIAVERQAHFHEQGGQSGLFGLSARRKNNRSRIRAASPGVKNSEALATTAISYDFL